MNTSLPRLALAWFALTAATTILAQPPTWQTPPGWTETRGGSGGKTIQVTTVAPQGEGSLAAALAIAEPRVIEFKVAGTIDLGGKSLKVTHPQLTIAGETAPSPGITLTGGGLGITTHDVIVRHLRIRPGAGDRKRKSGWEVDGLATGAGAYDVIIDHCSITWSTDENLSASGPRFEGQTPDDWRNNTSHRITFHHCLIGEGLHDSTHSKGPHSKGSLIHDNATQIALVGNLYISNDDRNPLFKGGARGTVVNNLIHNPGRRVMQYALNAGEWQGHDWQRGAMTIVGNVARKAASSSTQIAFLESKGPCDIFLSDNLYYDAAGKPLPAIPQFRDDQQRLSTADPRKELLAATAPLHWPPNLKARPASETAAWVLANAGARPWDRDPTDSRLIQEAKTGGGKIIDFEPAAGL